MKIRIEVSSSLDRFFKGRNEVILEDEGIHIINELLHLASIPSDEVGIIIKNGKRSFREDEVSNGDIIKLFPPIIAG